MSPTPEGKKEKKNKKGNQQLWRWTTRCAGLEAALSWRQSRGSRRSWQKTRVKYHFVQQRVRWDRKPKRTNRFPLFRKSAPLLRRMKRKITRTIKRQSCATAAPLPVSVYPGDLRSSLPWGITLDHLWDAEQEKTSRWWEAWTTRRAETPPKHS